MDRIPRPCLRSLGMGPASVSEWDGEPSERKAPWEDLRRWRSRGVPGRGKAGKGEPLERKGPFASDPRETASDGKRGAAPWRRGLAKGRKGGGVTRSPQTFHGHSIGVLWTFRGRRKERKAGIRREVGASRRCRRKREGGKPREGGNDRSVPKSVGA